MIYYSRLIVCFLFFLGNSVVYALPKIDEVIEKLGVGKNVKWEIDLERTSCHLGSDSGSNCSICSKNLVSESLIFVSQDKVDVVVSCINDGKNITTKTPKSWSVQLDDKKHNNIIKFDDDIYVILFNLDGKYMKLLSIPSERNTYQTDKVYKMVDKNVNKN